jgi:chemotaxis protein histidine kinase CheA
MGGDLTVESVHGKGSTFLARLPVTVVASSASVTDSVDSRSSHSTAARPMA